MGAVTFLYGVSMQATLLCLLVKPMPVLALLGWLHDAPPGDYRRWVSLGLIFSLVGDVHPPVPPPIEVTLRRAEWLNGLPLIAWKRSNP